jgi:chaperonin GroEL (HSP60 family)
MLVEIRRKMQKFLFFIFHHLMNDLNFQVVAAGANPVLITRGIEKTSKALVSELKLMSKEVMFV